MVPANDSSPRKLLGLNGWTTTTAVTLAPTVLGAIKIVELGQGDPQLIRALLGTLNVPTFILSLAFDFMFTFAATVIPMTILLLPLMKPQKYYRPLSSGGYVLLRQPRRISIAILIFLMLAPFTQWPGLIVACVFLAIEVAYALGGDKWHYEIWIDKGISEHEIHEGFQRPVHWLVQVQVTLAAIFFFGMSLFSSQPWLPIELIKTSDSDQLKSGYVLSVDSVSLTLLYTEGGIRKFPTSAVRGRYICPIYTNAVGNNIDQLSLVGIMLGRSANPYIPPECNTPSGNISRK